LHNAEMNGRCSEMTWRCRWSCEGCITITACFPLPCGSALRIERTRDIIARTVWIERLCSRQYYVNNYGYYDGYLEICFRKTILEMRNWLWIPRLQNAVRYWRPEVRMT
jgi:hypothetical protein